MSKDMAFPESVNNYMDRAYRWHDTSDRVQRGLRERFKHLTVLAAEGESVNLPPSTFPTEQPGRVISLENTVAVSGFTTDEVAQAILSHLAVKVGFMTGVRYFVLGPMDVTPSAIDHGLLLAKLRWGCL